MVWSLSSFFLLSTSRRSRNEAVNGLIASPILSILLKALVLTTYAVRIDHPGLVIVVLLHPLLHLQEANSYSLSESTVHTNLHRHNPYNVLDHSADVAAA